MIVLFIHCSLSIQVYQNMPILVSAINFYGFGKPHIFCVSMYVLLRRYGISTPTALWQKWPLNALSETIKARQHLTFRGNIRIGFTCSKHIYTEKMTFHVLLVFATNLYQSVFLLLKHFVPKLIECSSLRQHSVYYYGNEGYKYYSLVTLLNLC